MSCVCVIKSLLCVCSCVVAILCVYDDQIYGPGKKLLTRICQEDAKEEKEEETNEHCFSNQSRKRIFPR
jgi:hypothetical protein